MYAILKLTKKSAKYFVLINVYIIKYAGFTFFQRYFQKKTRLNFARVRQPVVERT